MRTIFLVSQTALYTFVGLRLEAQLLNAVSSVLRPMMQYPIYRAGPRASASQHALGWWRGWRGPRKTMQVFLGPGDRVNRSWS
jgi:hypothetical protein